MTTRRRLTTVLAALGFLLVTAPKGAWSDAGSKNARPAEVHWPGEGGRRIEVSLGLYLIDFARINLREESFDMAGYLDTAWTDPALAIKKGGPWKEVRRFRPGQVWTPALEFVNAVEQVAAEREGDLYISAEGRVTQRIRFSHKFSSTLDLRRFPFDRQTLRVVIAPFDPFAKDLDLAINRERVGLLDEASVTDWNILGVDARLLPSPGGDPAGERFVFEVKISRRWTFYVWRVLLPLTLLVFASWSVFWFEPTNLQPQISTSLAILLSFVTFNYAIDFSLPKVAYLTFIDRYTLTSFAFVVSVTFAVSVLHVTVRRKGEGWAWRLQGMARWAFPSAYVAAILAQIAACFR